MVKKARFAKLIKFAENPSGTDPGNKIVKVYGTQTYEFCAKVDHKAFLLLEVDTLFSSDYFTELKPEIRLFFETYLLGTIERFFVLLNFCHYTQ